ncbi:MAG: hypothetical protein KDA24_22805 [Deltaproteobacteria bacterium]|nr:hypothetical protein [Deltaproteobacteria bacterium]
MNRIATTILVIASLFVSTTAIAAPAEASFEARVTNVAGEAIESAYVCIKTAAKEVCAMSDAAGKVEVPAAQGAITMDVVASGMGPVMMTLQRKARRSTTSCEKSFTSHRGMHAVVTCSFDS